MKFPITRESLQSWDYNKDQDELRDEASYKEVHTQLKRALDIIYPQFQQQMHTNSYQKKFVFQLSQYIQNIRQQPIQEERFVNGILYTKINIDINIYRNEFIDKLTDKLKENFIGCNIIIDPLKTYIIIDWS